MIQPGRETNYPTSSGSVGAANSTVYGKGLFTVSGYTLTFGMLLLLLVFYFVYQSYFTRGRRRR